MKTIKLIAAILLLVLLLPISGCVFNETFAISGDLYDIKTAVNESSNYNQTVKYLYVEKDNDEIYESIIFLMIGTFVLILSAAVVAIALKKKFYSGLVSSFLVLIAFLWNNNLQDKIKNVCLRLRAAADSSTLKAIEAYENAELLSTANSMLFWPMVTMFIVGILELIVFVVKKRKKALNKEDSAHKTVDITSVNNIEELKTYKDLLDQGIISQEEFDTKKKQILGL